MILTASKLRSYKSCPRKYYFEYVECLKPLDTPEALSMGTSYHANLEKLLRCEELPNPTDEPGAMAEAFDKYIPWRTWDVKDVEKEFKVRLAPGVYLAGKIDALCGDGTPIEHKSSGVKPDEKYRERLFLDDQVSCYLTALSLIRKEPVTHIVYTVCQKPTIRLRGNESEADYIERCRAWYEESPEEKVTAFTVVRSTGELEEFRQELIYMGRSLQQGRKIWYRNPMACAIGSRCGFADICQNYDPDCLVGYVRKERESEELNGNFEW